jgi:hypothetical protein
MSKTELTIPELGLFAGTRGMLGAGIALLLGDRLGGEKRNAVGATLAAIGVLSTIPLAYIAFGRRKPRSAIAVARACYDAYARKDRRAIEALIADDFHFTSPLDNRLDRATYFARCWPNSEKIAGFDFVRLLPVADKIYVTYEGRNIDGHRFRNTEILTIRGHQIAEVEVYFGWSLPHKARSGGFIDSELP